MIDYGTKSSSGSESGAVGTTLLEQRIHSANVDGGGGSSISLTWLWEVIVRTKHLPDDLDPAVLFLVLRDRLRNPEREVRQHALRVLGDLIPVVDPLHLDRHMELLLPDLIVNLSHVAPSVRKGVVDVFRIHIKYSPMPNEVLRKLITAVPQDSHLMLGLLMAAPYFVSSQQINEDTLMYLLRQLSEGLQQETLKEAAFNSLVKIRSKLGVHRFESLIGAQAVEELSRICQEQNVVLADDSRVVDDNVILETEITLETGPAITMQIHEETSTQISSPDLMRLHHQRPAVVRMMTSEESESDLSPTRSPRKVHFGGEVVKMRTPESDSNQTSDENETSMVQTTSVVIDRPTSIKITLSDNVAAIKTRHKSLIPVRISTGGSSPGTPKKRRTSHKSRRLYKSAPELRKIKKSSKIPLPHQINNGQAKIRREFSQSDSNLETSIRVDEDLVSESRKVEVAAPKGQEGSTSETPAGKEDLLQPKVRRNSKIEDRLSPIPVHNEIQILHNLTRSPTRMEETKPSPQHEGTQTDNLQEEGSGESQKRPQSSLPVHQVEKFQDEGQERSETNELSQQTNFNSFKVCDVPDNENDGGAPIISVTNFVDRFLKDFSQKDDLWQRHRLLEELLANLHRNPSHVNEDNLPGLLQVLLACERNHRLQNRAQEALHWVISSTDALILDGSVDMLAKGLARMGPPNGVRFSLMVMQRISPRRFLESFMTSGHGNEKMLQVLIAATRTFPSSEINAIEGVKMAFDAMKDPKRATRQAALETLASLAQVAGNTAILETVAELTNREHDYDHLLRIVRTRLSRKQLPTLDANGNVRYSSPREQEEFDWLCGGSISIRKTMSLNSIRLSPQSATQNQTNNNNTNGNNINGGNYWKHNLRHDLIETTHVVSNSSSYAHSLEASEASNEESSSATNTKEASAVWALESTKLDNMTVEKAALYPVYVLHHPQLDGKSYRHFDRGRSNSPPQNNRPIPQFDLITNENNHSGSRSNRDKARRFFRQNEQFRKSFSSEQIYKGAGGGTPRHNQQHLQEPTSFSLSSRSSTTSTGSSTKSGIWLKEFRSGIPVPINSSADSKIKLRYNRHPPETYAGPLIVQDTINRTKLESPDPASPVIIRTSAQTLHPQQQPPLVPPRSSGSESSGYFTPPPDHHLKDQVLERYPSEETCFEENNNNQEPNFQIVDSEGSDVPDDVGILHQSQRQSSASSVAISDEPPPEVAEKSPQHSLQEVSLEEFDFDEDRRTIFRSKSKSEANLEQTILPAIERKNISSAPPKNEIAGIIAPHRFTDVMVTRSETSPVKTSLPGSVVSNEPSPLKTPVTETAPAVINRRLSRRSLGSRSSSMGRNHHLPAHQSTPRLNGDSDVIKPFGRPKEALSQSLSQMDSSDWEITMQGLNGLTRLARNHPEVVEAQMHNVSIALAKNIRNLRSQVARSACRATSEIFSTCKKGLEMELEELAGPLLQRTADTNKFIRSDANSALDVMSLNLSVPRVVQVVYNKGSSHQNCVVRAAATRLLSDIAGRIGCEKIFQLPKETRDKFLQIGANGLTEGSLETRKYAKSLMSILVKHQNFQKALADTVPQHTLRHISKAISSLK